MIHTHSVYDTDAHFIIDADTRRISDTSEHGTSVVQYDHNSERVTFEIPRYVDGHDMSVCNIVQIHYINIDSKNKNNQRTGVYVADDMHVSSEDENVFAFSWLISNGATQYAGPLSFVVRLACSEDGETVSYAWHTEVCGAITVTDGLYFGDEIADAVADAIWEWEMMLSAASEALVGSQEARDVAVQSAENADASAKAADASAQAAAASASAASKSEANAQTAEENAKAAQAAAEKARDEATEIAGGDFATNAALDEVRDAIPTAVSELDNDSGYLTSVPSHNHSASEVTSGTLVVARGGTGAATAAGARTALEVIGSVATYYPLSAAPDIDTLTDSLMIIHKNYSKSCPVTGGHLFIMQVFIGSMSASNGRTQIAFPYENGAQGLAIRSCTGGVWSDWRAFPTTDFLNRSTAVSAADTNYTTLMARGTSLHSAETTPAVNGAIAWTYG